MHGLKFALGLALAASLMTGVRAQIAQSRSHGVGNHALEGRLLSPSGDPIRTARVVLTPTGAPTGATAFSDEDGRFFFYDLRPGNYQLMVSASGFRTLTRPVDLNFGAQNLTLTLQPDGETVEGTSNETVHADVLALSSKARKEFERGREALRRGDYGKGRKHLQKALKEREFAAGLSALGIACIHLKEPEKAREAFEKALVLREDWGEAHLGLGLLENDAGDHAAAERHLLRAGALLPEEWRVDYELGRSYYHRSMLAEAENSLLKAHRRQPDYGSLHLLLANVFAMTERLPEALLEMREFLETAPKSPLAPQVREKVKLLEAELSRPRQ